MREGIGYYEGKSTHNINRISGVEDSSSRNNNGNSSVLLPDVKGSLSPNQYTANNSIIAKKQSLDRILRGLSNESSHDLHKIYKRPPAEAINRLHDINNIGVLKNPKLPIKVRPSNINIYRVGGGNSNSVISQNMNNIAVIGNEKLDIQGKAVISK